MILGASFDTPADNRRFRAKFAFPFDLLCDTDRSVGQLYGVADAGTAPYPSRTSYLINPAGIVERVYLQVDPSIHSDQVLGDLRNRS